MRIVVVVLFGLLLGCTSGWSLNKRVWIDSDFSEREVALMHKALLDWEDIIPGLLFFVEMAPHETVQRRARGQGVYVVRLVSHDQTCGGKVNPPADTAGWHFPYSDGRSNICLFTGYFGSAEEKPIDWRHIMLHEVGHELGLQHLPEPSVMTEHYPDAADDVTCSDARIVCEENGCDVSATRCGG